MLTTTDACKLVGQLEGVTEKIHFGSAAFWANNRMFATVWPLRNEVNLRLSLSDQRKFLQMDGDGFLPIKNAWGRQGWTRVQLGFTEPKDFQSALTSAWEHSKMFTRKASTIKSKKRRK